VTEKQQCSAPKGQAAQKTMKKEKQSGGETKREYARNKLQGTENNAMRAGGVIERKRQKREEQRREEKRSGTTAEATDVGVPIRPRHSGVAKDTRRVRRLAISS
jgi:hypothetical protein